MTTGLSSKPGSSGSSLSNSSTGPRRSFPFLLLKRIREAILDEAFQPGDRLVEVELAEKFKVSRLPVREALLPLEKEGTVIMSPYKNAIVKPMSVTASPAALQVRDARPFV